MQTRTMKKPTFKGHIGVREATKKPRNMVPGTVELTLQNPISHETGDKTFLARQSKQQKFREGKNCRA